MTSPADPPASDPADPPAYHLDGRLVDEAAVYAAACDPRRSIVVEACAGSGKTWMLVSRILRALLDGAQPQQILALTFTRKAAGEMRARLNEWLREFSCVGAPDAAQRERLTQALVARGLDAGSAAALVPALAGLHARLLDGGRDVAIRSFHAWFVQLLAAAPLDLLRDLGLPPQPTLIEDTSDLRDELFARFHAAVQADDGLRATYIALIGRHRRARVTGWLARAWRLNVEVSRADAAGRLVSAVPAAAQVWPQLAGLHDPAELVQREPLAGQLGALAARLSKMTNKTPHDAAAGLRSALREANAGRALVAACNALMTKERTPRKYLGDLPEQAEACAALLEIQTMSLQQQASIDHADMCVLSRVLLTEYAALKNRRGLADMGDLETAALALLGDPVRAGWVQQRLDATLRHVLIDEFQDTSPLQWHALHGWLSAYAGAGGGASGQRPPSVFIVGDPKQSIYRFRRAEPRVFDAAAEFVVEGLGGSVLECDHTRRCAPGIVSALNAAFTPASASGEWPGFRAHSTGVGAGPMPLEGAALRHLPLVPAAPRATAARDAEPFWRDTLNEPRQEPETQRRAQEAAQVAGAILQLLAAGQAPGSIMVLARKRVALRAVSQALSASGVPHVMPEPIRVGDEPEAQDLLAVLDVLVSPGHDLSLARALRSPIFGASDEELLTLSQAARARRCSWWAALMDNTSDGVVASAATPAAASALTRARSLLRGWSAVMPWLPPHDLLDRIVDEADVVARVAAVVPAARRATALQVIDAVLAAALDLDGGRYATPYGFVRALRSRRVEVRAAAAADAVSLLTVHGAKGLQADCVFVVDADASPPNAESGAVLVDWPVELDAPARVAFVANEAAPPPSLQAMQAAERAAQQREEMNGLYVAMTRAERLLVFSGTEAGRRGATSTWWQRVQPLAAVWQPASVVPSAQERLLIDVVVLPQRRSLPSALVVVAHAAAPAAAATNGDAARWGRAAHRLLEWATQPGVLFDAARWQSAAAAAAQAAGVDSAQAAAIVATAQRVLGSPDCARFFDAGSIAWAGNEVAVVVAGEPGRIDRLVAIDGAQGRQWWVLDYKLGASAPQQTAANLAQIAAYAAAVQALQPGDRVFAGFITAAGTLVLAPAA